MTTVMEVTLPPEVIEAGEVSPLAGGAQDPEDELRAVEVDQEAQAVIRLLCSGKVRRRQMSSWSYLKHKQIELIPNDVVPTPIVLIVLCICQG